MPKPSRYAIAKRITYVGALVNAGLGFIKLIGGLSFHSHALAADGWHSFADLMTDGMVLFASKYSNQQADDRHPYGHQRIETAATFLLAMLMILTGFAISWDAYRVTLTKAHTEPLFGALPIVLISIAANESLFYYTRLIGQRIRSALLIANAWHHRSDAASSLVVLLGLIGSLLGYHYWDALAALLVGLIIVHMGISYAWNSIKELVDTAIEPAQLKQVAELIQQVHGVVKIHQLRSRMMGPDIFIDVHIQVAPFLSVSEGHYIAQHVHYELTKQIPGIQDVTVHVDPEDDEIKPPSLHLPNRATLEQLLLEPWRKTYPAIDTWIIHYLAGRIILDLFTAPLSAQQQQRIKREAKKLNHPIQVRFFTTTSDRQKKLAKMNQDK